MKTKSEVLQKEFDFKTVHVGLTVNDDLWQHDKWVIIINGQHFDYNTGIGHREPHKNKWQRGLDNYRGFKNEASYYLNGRFKQDKENLTIVNEKIKNFTKVKPLKIDDVLYSLLIDSDVIHYSFQDWCDMFGYESDSRKAFKIYEDCQENAKKVSTFIDNIEEAQEKFQDY